jgi:hypothetical protein
MNLDIFHVPDGVAALSRRLVCLQGGSEFVECEWHNGNKNTKVGRRKDEESRSGT